MMGARKNVRVNVRVFVCEFGSWEFASFEIFLLLKNPPWFPTYPDLYGLSKFVS